MGVHFFYVSTVINTKKYVVERMKVNEISLTCMMYGTQAMEAVPKTAIAPMPVERRVVG